MFSSCRANFEYGGECTCLFWLGKYCMLRHNGHTKTYYLDKFKLFEMVYITALSGFVDFLYGLFYRSGRYAYGQQRGVVKSSVGSISAIYRQ
jgi:hypothetical protein